MFFRLPTVPRPQDCRVGESVTSSPSRVSLARSLDRSQVTCSPARQSWRTSSNLKQSRCSRACLSLETPATQTILSEWSTSEENYLAFFSCGSIHYLNLRFCNTLGQRTCVSEVFIIILFLSTEQSWRHSRCVRIAQRFLQETGRTTGYVQTLVGIRGCCK